MRITFSCCVRGYMAYDYYLKHPRSMCEIRKNQKLARNPTTYNLFKYTVKSSIN